MGKDVLYIADRHKKEFTYPIHNHSVYELNFVENAKGVRRIVGDSQEVIGDYDLCLITSPDLEHVWEQNECHSDDIREITVQFDFSMSDETLFGRNPYASITRMMQEAKKGLSFPLQAIMKVYGLLDTLSSVKDGFYAVQQFLTILYELSRCENARTLASSSYAKVTVEDDSRRILKVKNFISKNKKVFLWFGLGLMVVLLLSAGISSCTAMFASTGSAVIATSYLSEDEAMLGAEAQYVGMEAELQGYLDNYESTHSYDEYHFDLVEIEHDPYVLISILSALHEGVFTLSEVQGTLEMLFEKQYILTEEVVVETRYRWETEYDSEGNPYQVRVPYDYYICYVTLENFDLSHVPVYIMSEDQLSMYSAYMSALGNREDLFPGSSYVDKYIENPPADYDVPAEYLDDATFSALLTEAEKYLGYPYVWGGSSPDTSFDCSGFVSYVLTNSGLVNTGRLGAQGLYNICTPISSPQPGDLVFFQGTYDTSGVSHVGIYVGDQVMLHCGDPIQYTSLNSSYWQSHFYAYGRPPY